jgi:hypothetical protein
MPGEARATAIIASAHGKPAPVMAGATVGGGFIAATG